MNLDELDEFKGLFRARESAWKRAADLGIEIALTLSDGDKPSERIMEMFRAEWTDFELAEKSMNAHYDRLKASA